MEKCSAKTDIVDNILCIGIKSGHVLFFLVNMFYSEIQILGANFKYFFYCMLLHESLFIMSCEFHWNVFALGMGIKREPFQNYKCITITIYSVTESSVLDKAICCLP